MHQQQVTLQYCSIHINGIHLCYCLYFQICSVIIVTVIIIIFIILPLCPISDHSFHFHSNNFYYFYGLMYFIFNVVAVVNYCPFALLVCNLHYFFSHLLLIAMLWCCRFNFNCISFNRCAFLSNFSSLALIVQIVYILLH